MPITYDAVVVGARCAGSVLATRLAREGWDVLLVDRARFPSDTVSTHFLFPNSLARLERLGVMNRLRAEHDVPLLELSWGILGHTVTGSFTPVDGYERMSCIRRLVLDGALVDTAIEAGATTRFGTSVTGVMGDTRGEDSVGGVTLEGGEEVRARWVFGADGRNSTIARNLHLQKSHTLRGEMAMIFAYWRGLPETSKFWLDVREARAITWSPCEDDLHLLVLAGPPELVIGDRSTRERRYLEGIRAFSSVIPEAALDEGRRVSELVAVPEAMMRGFFRQSKGPGWALLGDAGHYKHPSTAQGISDAIEQAEHVADGLLGEDPHLEGYENWRNERAKEHYTWSFRSASWPSEHHGALHAGFADDESAGQGWRDLFTRARLPSEVFTPERMSRRRAQLALSVNVTASPPRPTTTSDLAIAYGEARMALSFLLRGLSGGRMEQSVPACPAWTLKDLVLHLAGIATDFVEGRFFLGIFDAWRDQDLAAARDAWTAGQIASRRKQPVQNVLAQWEASSWQLQEMLAGRTPLPDGYPSWLQATVVGDLAVRLHDARGALGVPGDRSSAATQIGLRLYVRWLEIRLAVCELPALVIRAFGARQWQLGRGDPVATLSGDPFTLFRVLSGRRTQEQIRSLDWEGDLGPFLDVLSPYELPESPLAE